MKNKIEHLLKAVVIASVFLFFGVVHAHAGTLTNFSYSADSYVAGASTTYTFAYTIETDLHTADMDIVAYPIFPSGFTVPGDFGPSDVTVTVNGSPRTVTQAWLGLGVRISSDIAAGSNVVVQSSRIINPSYGGTFNFVWVRTADGGGNEIDSPVSVDPINIVTVPTVVSAKITGGNEMTIVYSEAVTGATTDYTYLQINGSDNRNITNLAGDGTATAILTFDGVAVGTDAVGTVDINDPPTSVKSVANNIELEPISGLTITDGQLPTVTSLGDGISDYSLPSTCPSTACNRGDIFGTQIIFSETLDNDSKTAVENAITAGASIAPRTFVWNNNYLRIYTTEATIFYNDITANITDLSGNISYNLTLIDSLFTASSEIWVDNDYTSENSDGHIWGDDAFDNISEAVEAIAEEGTIHILAGTYTESIYISKNGIILAGPESGDEAIIVSDCDYAITIDEANDVTVSHLKLLQTNGGGVEDEYCYDEPVVRVGWDSERTNLTANEIAGGYNGVALRYDSSENTLTNNYIHDNDWGGIVMLGFGANSFTGNVIQNNEYGISLGYGPDRSEQQDISGTVISGNTISGNDYGIYYYEDDQDPSGDGVVVGPNNEITENWEGIYVEGNAYNLHINGNKIYGNTLPDSALHVESSENGLDVTENWWGDETGPTIISNPTGTGDVISINNTQNSTFINFRPFCLDEDCEELSEYEVSANNLISLFGNGGTITVAEGEDYNNVTALSVNEDTIISLETGNGMTIITLPAGTVITQTGGGDFSATDLEASEIDLGGLTGFADDETPLGAVQWGLPDMGLTFSQPIRIDLYVGTALNGQTLIIKRMPAEGGEWTDNGIVDPGTCEVSSEGICSFETTKASDFVALEEDDDTPTPTSTPTPTPTPTPIEEEAQKAKITSWKAYKYNDDKGSCEQKIKLTIRGKHFDKNAEVKIGGKEASSVDKKSNKEIVAKFCLTKLLEVKSDHKRKITVTNPNADTEEADKQINLDEISFDPKLIPIETKSSIQKGSEDVKNIQNALVKLGLLDVQYATGIYGPITTEAVKKFQEQNGLEQTGTVGPLTRAKLFGK